MFEDVLQAVRQAETVDKLIVFSPEPKVLKLAGEHGAVVLRDHGLLDLNGSVSIITKWCVKKAVKSLLILPCDIPLVSSEEIDRLASSSEGDCFLVIAPSRDGKGTNALLRTPPNVIDTHYGENSFQKHIEAAVRRGVDSRVLSLKGIALDIDSQEDLLDFIFEGKNTCTLRYLRGLDLERRIYTTAR